MKEGACDVAIVGLGPVGVTLACLLAAKGHSVVGFDSALEVYDLPRAVGIDHESMRVFQALGLAEEMASIIEPYRPSEYRSAAGEVLRRLLPAPEPFPLSWPPNLTFIQPDLERMLRRRAARFGNLRLRLGAEVTQVSDLDGEPVVEIATGDERALVRCRYLVGCDGAASFVRKAMSVRLEDLDFDEPWLVVDMLLNAPLPLPELNIQFCDPARPSTYVRGPGSLRRWEFMLLPGETPAEMTNPERIWRLLAPWLRPDQAEIWRAATYRFHALVAETWRRGNVLLAGDAAHQTPPFLAQGLNQGIRDAANLAWKLSAVLKGAPERLLDSYQTERRPQVREVIAITKMLGREICERDPAAAEARNRRLLDDFVAGRGVRVRQDLLPPLRVNLSAADERRAPAPGEGEQAPQPWVLTARGRARLDDVWDRGFRLLCANGFAAEESVKRAKALGMRVARLGGADGDDFAIEEEGGLLASWMTARNCRALLVRPDHIVYAAVSTSEDLAAALDRLGDALAN